MKFKSVIILFYAATLLAGCRGGHHRHQAPLAAFKYPLATIDTNTQIGQFHSIQYTQVGKSLEQTLDLYIPLQLKPPYPVVIWVHGGAWMHGDKTEGCMACQALSNKYAVASVNYRLDMESQFPCQVWDVKAAVRFLRAHADHYKLDPERIAIWGSSAGGHLAALIGTTGAVKTLEGNEGYRKYSSKVQAVVDWCGPADLNTPSAQASPDCKIRYEGQTSPVFVLMGGRMDKKSLADASPVTYVSKDDPPFLIMHGDEDDAVPPAQSEELYTALRSAGVDASFYLLKGYGHAFGAPAHFKLVEEFLDSRLQKVKPGHRGSVSP